MADTCAAARPKAPADAPIPTLGEVLVSDVLPTLNTRAETPQNFRLMPPLPSPRVIDWERPRHNNDVVGESGSHRSRGDQ